MLIILLQGNWKIYVPVKNVYLIFDITKQCGRWFPTFTIEDYHPPRKAAQEYHENLEDIIYRYIYKNI